jgi:5-methylcytosine-specific restriction endonuclease McrA
VIAPKFRPATLSVQQLIGPEATARVFAKTGGLCAWCGNPLKAFRLDHVIPSSRGGSNEESNLVPCCGSCNSAKGNRPPEVFHRYRCLRKAGFPREVTVRVMDWLIDNGWTTFRYDPLPWFVADDSS